MSWTECCCGGGTTTETSLTRWSTRKTPLADGGYILLLTPKAGRDGHVEPSEIGEAAPTAGLSQTSTVSAGKNWSATRLVAPKARR